MLRFNILASGSKGNCCIVESKDTAIMIDCGMSKKYLFDALKKINLNIDDINALLITHTHSDHISQLKHFKSIPTYSMCDLEVDELIKVEAYQVIEINNIKVKILPTSHDCDNSIGFVIFDDDESLVYITDTGYVMDNVKKEIINKNYYIFESNHDIEMLMETNRPIYVKQRIISDIGHLCNEDSATILDEVVGDETKEIILAHISEEGNSYEQALKVANEIIKKNINIRVAKQNEIVSGGLND